MKVDISIIKKKLTKRILKSGGRNNRGRITSFHRGGGHKRRYRYIDFSRKVVGVPGVVKSIEKDPNRSSNIALICYSNGLISYVLAPEGLAVGDYILSGNVEDWEDVGVSRVGSIISVRDGQVGEYLCNVEMFPGKGGQIARSAGSYVEFIKKYENEDKVLLKLRSGEHRVFSGACKAMVGTMSNIENKYKRLAKAGVSRWLGRRPVVRGVAMNPVDHPHGGGEGKKSGSNKTPWGKITKGQKTRKKSINNKLIVKRRK